MSIQTIVKYNKLRAQLTPEELVLADTLYHASESDKALIIESLQPQTAKKKAGRKPKSARAQSLQKQIQSTTKRSDGDRCQFVVNDTTGEVCGATVEDAIHDSTYLSSHPFESGARPVRRKSAASVKDDSYEVNLGGAAVNAGAVAGGSSSD